jgi:YegS/Rv2252/BmrU family lipid kinase
VEGAGHAACNQPPGGAQSLFWFIRHPFVTNKIRAIRAIRGFSRASCRLKARFIFNPHSGSNRRNPYLRDRALDFIRHERWDASVVSTTHPRHATALAKQAAEEGCELVVAIGGDGTMNEVATALIGTPTIFGLIPCGSGNGLGRHVGIPGPGQGAFRTLAEGEPMVMDTGLINGDPFFCAAGVGFEALIAGRFAVLANRGFTGYLRTGLKAWFGYKPESYLIHHAGGKTRVEALTLAIANSAQYGNNAFIAPGASICDGLLNLTAVPRVNFFNAVPLFWRLFHGSLDRVPSVVMLHGDSFVIERDKPGWVHTDGEPRAEASRLEITVRPKSLRIMVPRGRTI